MLVRDVSQESARNYQAFTKLKRNLDWITVDVIELLTPHSKGNQDSRGCWGTAMFSECRFLN